MTTKGDSKYKPMKDKRPKLKKEKLKDLTTDGAGVRGGHGHGTGQRCVEGGGGGTGGDGS